MAKCGCGSCSCTVEAEGGKAGYCSDVCKADCGSSRSCDCGHPDCKP